jgi:hypothetical protein
LVFLLLIYIIYSKYFFKKTNLKIPTEGFTDGMHPSAFDRERGNATITDEFTDRYHLSAFHNSLVQMQQSPINLQTDTIRRHCTESGGNPHSPTNLQTDTVCRHFTDS